jgi:hypothetical protein
MVVAKYDLGVFVEPDDFKEILKGVSKFVPNSATDEMPAKDSGFSKLVPNSATDEPATRYTPLLRLLGIAMNARIPGRKMPGKCLGAWSEVSEGSALLLIFEGFEGRWVAILLRASRLRRDDGNRWLVAREYRSSKRKW